MNRIEKCLKVESTLTAYCEDTCEMGNGTYSTLVPLADSFKLFALLGTYNLKSVVPCSTCLINNKQFIALEITV